MRTILEIILKSAILLALMVGALITVIVAGVVNAIVVTVKTISNSRHTS